MPSQIPLAVQTIRDQNGRPLIGGKVYFYVPGTETPKDTYKDYAGTTVNTNPVILDGTGSMIVWGNGIYRQVAYDINGVLIWDQLTRESGMPTTSAAIADAVTDETGTGVLVFNNSPTLITPKISGITTGVAPTAGNVGETIVTANATGISSATLSSLASFTLTPGVWLLFGSITFQNTSSAITSIVVGASLTANAVTGLDRATYLSGLNGNTQGAPSPILPVTVVKNTVAYMVGAANFAGGTTIATANMTALRIA